MPGPRPPRWSLIASVLALVLALVVGACGVAPGRTPGDPGAPGSPALGGSDAPPAPLRAGEFGEATVTEAITLLAESGIATFETPESAAPMREVAQPESAVRLLLDQVRAMALEAHTGGGIEGAELDALFDVPADLAPPSFVLAGYVAAVDTPGARLARSLMGTEAWTAEDWRRAPSVVFPKIVLVLFTSDVVRERQQEAAALGAPDLGGQVASVGGFVPPSGQTVHNAADDPCTTVTSWISGALTWVFDKLKLGESSSGGGTILRTIWNFVVSILEVVITALVKEFEQYVLNWIGRIAAIVGTVSMVISWVQPWTASVQVDRVTEKGIDGVRPSDEGVLLARIVVPAGWDWPAWAKGCAKASGRDLPNMHPEGTPVHWEPLIQNPGDLVLVGPAEPKLDAQGAARLPFTTLSDAVHSPWKTFPGAIYARVTFDRQSLKDFAKYLQGELWKELPSIVYGPLQAFLKDPLDQINNKLGTLVTVSASGPAMVLFHVQDATPPPSPPPTPPDDQGSGEFCRLYRDYVAWATALGPDTDVTQELAREIAARFEAMHPVAPNELRDDVILVYAIYATFGKVDEPWNLPGAGQIAGPRTMERLPGALKAMHTYCGLVWPGP